MAMLEFCPKGGLPITATGCALSISTVRKSAVSTPAHFGWRSYPRLPGGSSLKNEPRAGARLDDQELTGVAVLAE